MTKMEVMIMILGMTAVTYLPRVLPFFLAEKLHFGKKTEKFLKLVPYTAMSALVFPGVFGVDDANPVIGIAGAAVAALLAWRKCPVVLCVLAAVAVDFVLYLFL